MLVPMQYKQLPGVKYSSTAEVHPEWKLYHVQYIGRDRVSSSREVCVMNAPLIWAQFTQDAEHLTTCARKFWDTLWSMRVFTQVASNIKGFACKFACKSAYASCVNGALNKLGWASLSLWVMGCTWIARHRKTKVSAKERGMDTSSEECRKMHRVENLSPSMIRSVGTVGIGNSLTLVISSCLACWSGNPFSWMGVEKRTESWVSGDPACLVLSLAGQAGHGRKIMIWGKGNPWAKQN